MEEVHAQSTESITRKDRIDLATKLFVEYHASLRAYDAIFAALSVGMLAIIPVIAGFYIYVFKEVPYHFRFTVLIFASLLANLFVIGFLKIFLALIKERSRNFFLMQMNFAEIAVFSEMRSANAILEIYEKINVADFSEKIIKKSVFHVFFRWVALIALRPLLKILGLGGLYHILSPKRVVVYFGLVFSRAVLSYWRMSCADIGFNTQIEGKVRCASITIVMPM